MIAIILAVLGVPIWLVLGAFDGVLWSRCCHVGLPWVSRPTERVA